jgi:hypothetical protein
VSNEDKDKRMKDEDVAEGASINRITVPIKVTPLFIHKKETICLIEPPSGNKKGEMLGLNRNQAYTLEFTLEQTPPSPGPQNLRFATNASDAFWCDEDDCPKHETLDGQYESPQVTNDGKTLLVTARPTGPDPSAVHYVLNFDNNTSFDPIIIHD